MNKSPEKQISRQIFVLTSIPKLLKSFPSKKKVVQSYMAYLVSQSFYKNSSNPTPDEIDGQLEKLVDLINKDSELQEMLQICKNEAKNQGLEF